MVLHDHSLLQSENSFVVLQLIESGSISDINGMFKHVCISIISQYFQFLNILHFFLLHRGKKTRPWCRSDLWWWWSDLWLMPRAPDPPSPFLQVSGPHLSFLNKTDFVLIETSQDHIVVPDLISWWKCSPPVDPSSQPSPAQACRPLVFIFSRS